MAEVGLVAFARIARRVAEAVVPAYKGKYSKRVFTQLVFVICLRAPETTCNTCGIVLRLPLQVGQLCRLLGLDSKPH